MSQSPPPGERGLMVTLAGVATLVFGSLYLAAAVFLLIRGERGVEDFVALLNSMGLPATYEKKGDPALAGQLLNVVVIIYAVGLLLIGLVIAFAGYRVLMRRGRVLGLIVGVLFALAGAEGIWKKYGPDKMDVVLALPLLVMAYGLFTVIVLLMRREEFPKADTPSSR